MNLYAEGWEKHEEIKIKKINSRGYYSSEESNEEDYVDKKITKTKSKIKLRNDLKKE